MDILIKNGRVINPANLMDEVADVAVSDGKIEAVGSDIKPADGARVIDAKGKYVMPGLVDLHVHFRDPGQTHKEDIRTGSQAAAAGGVTTVCCMPNTTPSCDNIETLKYILEKADKESPIHVEQLSSVTKGQSGSELVDMKAMLDAGALCFSEDGKSVMDTALCEKAFEEIAKLDALFMDHCEDMNIRGNGVLNKGVASEKYGVPGISNAVEDVIASRDIFLAAAHGARIHLCHCSTAASVELVRMAKKLGYKVTAEVCPHHFTLTDADITENDSNYKMNPPLRTKADVDALIEGLCDGTMEVISTDHAPHAKDEKAKDFMSAPFGIVGIETSAALTYTYLVKTGKLSIMQMADRMSYTPSRIIRKYERGDLSVGKEADIMIFDPEEKWIVDAEKFVSKGHNTPYNGYELYGKVIATICGGKVVFEA